MRLFDRTHLRDDVYFHSVQLPQYHPPQPDGDSEWFREADPGPGYYGPGTRALCAWPASRGSSTETRNPLLGTFASSISPPYERIAARATVRPSPVPPVRDYASFRSHIMVRILFLARARGCPRTRVFDCRASYQFGNGAATPTARQQQLVTILKSQVYGRRVGKEKSALSSERCIRRLTLARDNSAAARAKSMTAREAETSPYIANG
jgi:hypothetical protein